MGCRDGLSFHYLDTRGPRYPIDAPGAGTPGLHIGVRMPSTCIRFISSPHHPSGQGSPTPMLPADDAEDRRRLARMREGDESAFDALFRIYYGPLVGLAESLLRTRA